jgi:hypothetical protein
VLAALLLTSTIAHAPAHAEFTLEQEQAFGTELKELFASEALAPLYTRIGDHDIWMYETVDHLRNASSTMGFPSNNITPKTWGFYVKLNNSFKKPFFAFVYGNMKSGSKESKRRVVAHEMMHALDYEFLKVSASPEFKAELDKDMNYVKNVQSKATGEKRKSNAKILENNDYYMTPIEAFAEAGARAIFPPSNTHNRENFAKIFKNVLAYTRAKLIAEKIIFQPLPMRRQRST